MKHQGSLKRFLRDLHRSNEREQNAASAAKREVARLNALVGGPSSTGASTFTGPTSVYKQPAARGASEEERKRQLKELEALGVALPDEARRELAMVGDWEETSVEVRRAGEREMTEKEKVQVELARVQKRKFEEEEKERKWRAMDEDERAMRGFSIQTKSYPGEGGEEFDPGVLFKGKGKAKETVVKEEKPKVEIKKEEGEVAVKEEDLPEVKKGEDVEGIQVKSEEGVEVKKEDSEATAVGDGVVFKKRKVKNIRKK